MSARETYRVAVIGRTGKGNYGHGLDRVWKEIDAAEIVAVADDDPGGRKKAAERLGVKAAYADYREMLRKERPQIVSVAPRWLDPHHDMVLACAEHGASVFLEKPMCRTLAEADAMVAACERSHVKLAIAHQTRYSPKVKVAREILRSGLIGQALEFRGRGKEDRRGGGEDLWVLGTHVFDLMRLFGGDARWCYARVTQGGRPVERSDVKDGSEGIGPLAGDGVEAMYGLASGVTAFFSSHRGAAGSPTRFGLTIGGSKGLLEMHTGYLPAMKLLRDSAWSPGRTGSRWEDVSSAGVGEPEPLEDTGLHGGNLLIARDLIQSIEEDRQPLGSVYEARGVTEMIVAVFESHRLGRPVTFPLENRENPLLKLS
ncbi:MAG: Gfo/Idh/MocA family oxidoreductase [Planctomycetota bacterium]|nr:Gfo/Idh/MocA family oxidoreductase [Planctomycetota bacterium]